MQLHPGFHDLQLALNNVITSNVKLRGALGGTTEPDLGSLGRLRVNCIDRGKAPLMAYIYSVRTNRRAGQGLLYKKE